MDHKKNPDRKSVKSRATEIWVRADKEWERGKLRLAFQLMLAAAKMGESGAQSNVGYMYDNAIAQGSTSRPRFIGTGAPTVGENHVRLTI